MLVNIIAVAGGLIVVGLAAVGIVAVVGALQANDDDHAMRAEARRSARRIIEISRRAQAAILGEALLRAWGSVDRYAPRHAERPRRWP